MKILSRLLKGITAVTALLLLLTMLGLGTLLTYFHARNQQPFGNASTTLEPGRLGQYVNPFIGTGGYYWVCAHNFPGASVPFSAVRLSPDTWSTVFRREALNTSGYYYPDNRIMGFSHTRLSGTGATDGGHFRVIPAVDGSGWNNYLSGKHLRFRHSDERAFPGYYRVYLKNPGVTAEFTATERTGVHRYHFDENVKPTVLIDISSVLGNRKAEEAAFELLPDKQSLWGEVRTWGTFSGRYGGIKVYFYATFDQPYTDSKVWSNRQEIPYRGGQVSGEKLGVGFSFNGKGGSVRLRLGISHVSRENARENLVNETGGKSFEEIVASAVRKWEETLSKVEIATGNHEQKVIFYTALYRSFQMPTLFQDVSGDYFGFDKQVHRAVGFSYYTDLSLWDTFRTLHPLYTLIAPNEQRDMVVSLLKMKDQGGWLPRWPAGNGYSNSMLGSPADMVIAETWHKNIRDFDILSAFEGMKQVAESPTPPGSPYSGRRGIEYCLECAYCPSDKMSQAVSRTLEYAWADYAIAVLADSLGFVADAERYYERAQWYKNTWNPESRYFHPRDSDGNFQVAFKPLKLTYLDSKRKYTDDYVEGSALQWRYAVPFDPEGLIALVGGREVFVEELDRFFALSHPGRARYTPGSYYWHGNEPDIHAPFLFNDAGRPDLTQKWTRWILDNKYAIASDGLDGNDDGATLSSWYIFSSLGIYPLAGTDIYHLTAPLFERAEVMVGNNRLIIVADNFAHDHHYVSKIWLNGELLAEPKLRHHQIANGGELRFELAIRP